MRALAEVPGATAVHVRTLTGKTTTVRVGLKQPVAVLKERICLAEGIPADQQRIIFAGQQLKDDKTLAFYRVHAGTSLHLVLKLCGC